MEDPSDDMIEEVRVLLIDHDKEFATDRMIDLLQFHECKVTTVTALTAMSVLSKGNKDTDVMIINVNSPDPHCFELLAQAVTMNIISIFVCDEYNKILAKKALNDGAYLYIKKPLGEEVVKHLWQFVLREKIEKEKVIKRLKAYGDQINLDDNNISKTVKRRTRIIWDDDLHFKFVEATEQLGEGRCYSSDILKVMNVPGLTMKHVSSHLQKCRTGDWRPQKERRYTRRGSSYGSQQRNRNKTSLEREKRNTCRNFGRLPCLHQTNIPNQIQKGPKSPPVLKTYSGSSMMPDIRVENVTINGPGATNTDFQQCSGERNMFDPSNILATSNADDIGGSDSNEWENCDVYFNFNNMDDLIQNSESPSATLPNEHGSDDNTECSVFKNINFSFEKST